MTRRVRIGPEAEAELREAIRWYDQQRKGLGGELDFSVGAALERLAASSDASSHMPEVAADVDVRRVLVERFPYQIVFVESFGEVRVVAIAHLHRRPGYWVDRPR